MKCGLMMLLLVLLLVRVPQWHYKAVAACARNFCSGTFLTNRSHVDSDTVISFQAGPN